MAAIRAMQALEPGTPLASLLVADRGTRWALVRAYGAAPYRAAAPGLPRIIEQRQ